MHHLAARATATALHTLLARAEEDEKGAKGSSSSSSSKSASKTSSASSKATSSATASTWIYRNTDLVISICVCSIVFTIVCLTFAWWWLKRRHKKLQKAKEAAVGPSDTASEFESKGGPLTTPLPNIEQQERDYSTYPHFNASQPPPPVQVSFDDDASIIDEKQHQPQHHQQQAGHHANRQTGGGYSLGAISERSEEQEHVNEGLYGNRRDTVDEYGDDPQAGRPDSRFDARDSYYYDERPNGSSGGLAPTGGARDDRDSVYSVQEGTRYV